VEFYQSVAHLIGVAIAQRNAQRALRQRVKEVTYLYRITELLARPDIGIEEITQRSPQLVAHGCPVPRAVTARVRVDDREGWWPEQQRCAVGLTSSIIVQGRERGGVEIRCGDWQPEHAEAWEREAAQRFLDTVAAAIATVLQRSELRAEKEQLQAQVQHAERLATIGTLVAVLAHEVNEPLNAIHGFTELARKDPSLSVNTRADLGKVITASEHVRGVIGKLLAFGRASEPTWQPTSLNQVVDDALCFIAPSCTRASVRVVRRLDGRLCDLVGDREQLCQIVVNLCTNAIRAMPTGGVLTVETRAAPDGSCHLIVEDTGVGISDEVKQKMFQPFFTTHHRHRGLGLGLTVVQGIVSSHGGRVDVESELGRGTRMTVSLPVHQSGSVEDVSGHDEDGA
jgi:signal transduction histidine kinase